MRIVAVFNLSGGVGKTTLTQNQSYHMAKRGFRTVVVDLDPQGWATHFMADDPEDFERTIKDLLLSESDEITLPDIPLVKDLYGVDLIPANLSLRIAESSLPSLAFKEYDFVGEVNKRKMFANIIREQISSIIPIFVSRQNQHRINLLLLTHLITSHNTFGGSNFTLSKNQFFLLFNVSRSQTFLEDLWTAGFSRYSLWLETRVYQLFK